MTCELDLVLWRNEAADWKEQEGRRIRVVCGVERNVFFHDAFSLASRLGFVPVRVVLA